MSYSNKTRRLIQKLLMTRTVLLTANVLMIPCLIGILLVKCNGIAAVSLYITFCFVRVPYYSTTRVNTIDLSPRYAGTLQGILSSSSAIAGLFMAEFFNSVAGHEVCAVINLYKVLCTTLFWLIFSRSQDRYFKIVPKPYYIVGVVSTISFLFSLGLGGSVK